MTTYIKPRSTLPNREVRLFNVLVKSFEPSFYGPGDACLMEEFVFCFFVVEDAKKVLRKEGMVVQGQKGTMVASPYARVVKDNVALMNQLATKLRISAQQRKLPQHVNPSMNKVRNNQVYDPSLTDWETQQRDPAKNWRNFKDSDETH